MIETQVSQAILEELVGIRQLLDAMAERQKRQEEQEQRSSRALMRIHDLLDRFTDNGSSITQLRTDPLLLAYVGVVGSLLGDRLDGAIANKGEEYVDEFLKGAVVLARKIVTEVDAYHRQSDPRAALETLVSQEKRGGKES